MERGVYFDAWFPRQHNYHPSLPARRLKMLGDLRDYHATVLVWSALGGGSISLPFLEQEAFGKIDPRFRFYGFMNDSEFIKECQKLGIKVFGIVFEVQGWEFPVELNEEEDTILALNELRGAGKQDWIGLREFNQNRYPKLWSPFENYFPDGLVNSLGEKVTDLTQECCSRDIYGNALHALWVECPDRDHQCYLMDRNNPVWREYLKAIIRIQIDVGVDGIQLDEAELPLTSLFFGGCFCKDCMHEFRQYLQALPTEAIPSELDGVDLNTFHYGEWLRERGYDFQTNREESPLFWDYVCCQRGAVTRYFAELADYAHEYAESKGRTVLVSGNFYHLLDQYYSLEPYVDLVITEMQNTRYRQPAWYRYVAGFVGHKPVIVVENPYNGIIPELVEQLQIGRGYDLFRMSIYEAAALGANMSVPYGSWMGSVIEDAFYAPHKVCVEIQDFLAGHDHLYSQQTYSEIAVIYSVGSNFQMVAHREQFAADPITIAKGQPIPFWKICETLVDAKQPFDVVFFPDGELRTDTLQIEALRQYRTLILPHCRFLTPQQGQLLSDYLVGGGHLHVISGLGMNLPDEQQQTLLQHPNTTQSDDDFVLSQLANDAQLQIDIDVDMAVHIQQVAGGAAIHLIRYDYDADKDEVPILGELSFAMRLPRQFQKANVYSPDGDATVSLSFGNELHHLQLSMVPLYTVILLSR